MPNNVLPPKVIDEKQLTRIESVHRGFFYQHLYTVGCLLLALKNKVEFLVAEKDEDIEIATAGEHLYLQVKTRTKPLAKNDISGALDLFEKIKKKHTKRERSRQPSLIIISNSNLGRELSKSVQDNSLPDRVQILYPGSDQNLPCLPPAWKDVPSGFDWCIEQAKTIPYITLSPNNLVYKLAAWVQRLCTGGLNKEHIVIPETIHSLLEQIVTQLQVMPTPPLKYYPLNNEFQLASDSPIRIISGLSGAGKTAWVAHEAARIGSPVVYFDAIGTEEDNFLPSFVREIAAALVGKNSKGLGEILMPGSSSIDSLRALNIWLTNQKDSPYLILDNIQETTPETVKKIISACSRIKFVLLAQPGTKLKQQETILGVSAKELKGWSIETIGAILEANNINFRLQDCVRLRAATGGLPLYTLSAITLIQEQYCYELSNFLNEIELAENIEQTTQERILSSTFEQLEDKSKTICSILKICKGIPLSKEELITIIHNSSRVPKRALISSLRGLIDKGIIQRIEDGCYKLHDAFGILAQSYHDSLSAESIVKIKQNILETLFLKPETNLNIDRIDLHLRLLNDLGRVSEFIDICTVMTEIFHELGLSHRIKFLLESKLSSKYKISEIDTFWILDTLSFWDIQDNKLSSAKQRLKEMQPYLTKCAAGSREYNNFYMKKMLIASREKHLSIAKDIYENKLAAIRKSQFSRIAQYNYAIVLYESKNFPATIKQANSLISVYLNLFGLSQEDIFGKNPPEILAKIHAEYDPDDFKRMADCYDLLARAIQESGERYSLEKLFAFKFYNMANAINSAMKVGQDIVADFISPLGDIQSARNFIEQSLLPSAEDLKLMDWVIPIRSQYAVVLAYCGAYNEARKQLTMIKPFRNAVGSNCQEELINHASLVQNIIAGKILPPKRKNLGHFSEKPNKPRQHYPKKTKIGRNEPCPCLSGKKYKKCCGR
ncbi:SEC-C metal-binding domain-containing protein [Maridesulfovibrio sp.]|uniref:SEC-C metal-binding domain-containing protein n=1 Tax=Maridesulfovibrio sp. TaxID=2795000 RepID=UPI0029F5C9C3|nr:SEC-C metal-binding domain-containing protein [Maridesulfovibrio sp.]